MKTIDIFHKRFRLNGDTNTYFCVGVESDNLQNVIKVNYVKLKNNKLPIGWNHNGYRTTTDIDEIDLGNNNSLNGPYRDIAAIPEENGFKLLDTIIPDTMDDDMRVAMRKLKKALNNDIAGFVCERLQLSRQDLAKALMIEQIEAVALAIYNIEARKQGIIIGDQTGIGKGRQAAAILRYGIKQGLTPIFLTEKANLFSDLYRDCKALGIDQYEPFIINASSKIVDFEKPINNDEKLETWYNEQRTKIENDDTLTDSEKTSSLEKLDEKYENKLLDCYPTVYKSAPKEVQDKILNSHSLPPQYKYVVTTYSQFNKYDVDNIPIKCNWLSEIVKRNDTIFVMDEAHNAAGSGQTSMFFRSIVDNVKGIVFLSATYAKRPDNMAIFSIKTAMRETNMQPEAIADAISKGGVPLQELLSAKIVREGQMVRRERSSDGVQVDYITLNAEGAKQYGVDDTSATDGIKCDKVTKILRDIIAFQREYIYKYCEQIKIKQPGKKDATAKNPSAFSRLFHIIDSLLLGIKVDSIVSRTINQHHAGKAIVIAISKTGESAIINAMNSQGATKGDKIRADYSTVLMGALQSLFTYTLPNPIGTGKQKTSFSIDDMEEVLGYSCRIAYNKLISSIQNETFGVPISPIDVIVSKLEKAGIRVGECTKRTYTLDYINDNYRHAYISTKRKPNTTQLFADFQNNKLDVLIINSSGATGASAHAIPTSLVPPEQVKQRVMIVAQPELNVSTEVQKRGRINRTGQIYQPIYEYISSVVPAELRTLMMLKRKLKSLDANTTSSQRQNDKQLDCPDFENKYGNEIVTEWCRQNSMIYEAIDMPLGENIECISDAAHKVSGRIAILSVEEQQRFYDEILDSYDSKINELKEQDLYDLETTTMDYQAKLLKRLQIVNGFSDSYSSFAQPTYRDLYECKCDIRPYAAKYIDEILTDEHFSAQKELHTKIKSRLESEINIIENNILEKSKENGFVFKDLKDAIHQCHVYSLPADLEKQITIAQNAIDTLQKRIKKLQFVFDRFGAGKTFVDFNILNDEEYNGTPNAINIFESTFRKSPLVVSLGIKWSEKDKPIDSKITVEMAVASSIKTLKYNLVAQDATSGYNRLTQLMTLSNELSRYDYQTNTRISHDSWLDSTYGPIFHQIWNDQCKINSTGIRKRYIITGNILQAYIGDHVPHGSKTIFFTRQKENGDMETVCGLLLPADYNPHKNSNDKKNNMMVAISDAWHLVHQAQELKPFEIIGQVQLTTAYTRYDNNCIYINERGKSLSDTALSFAKDIRNLGIGTFQYKDTGFGKGHYCLHISHNQPEWDILKDYLEDNKYRISLSADYINSIRKTANTNIADPDDCEWQPLDWDENNIPYSDPPIKTSNSNRKRKMRMYRYKLSLLTFTN